MGMVTGMNNIVRQTPTSGIRCTKRTATLNARKI